MVVFITTSNGKAILKSFATLSALPSAELQRLGQIACLNSFNRHTKRASPRAGLLLPPVMTDKDRARSALPPVNLLLKTLGHLGERASCGNQPHPDNSSAMNDLPHPPVFAELVSPWQEVLKDLSITVSFEEDGHVQRQGAFTRNNISKPSIDQLAAELRPELPQKLL